MESFSSRGQQRPTEKIRAALLDKSFQKLPIVLACMLRDLGFMASLPEDDEQEPSVRLVNIKQTQDGGLLKEEIIISSLGNLTAVVSEFPKSAKDSIAGSIQELAASDFINRLSELSPSSSFVFRRTGIESLDDGNDLFRFLANAEHPDFRKALKKELESDFKLEEPRPF